MQARGKTKTISPAPHSHEGQKSAESKTTQWNRKSVFLGIHLHSNYSDILGRVHSTGVTQCTVAKRTFGTLIRAMTRKTKLLACKKKKDRKKSNQPKNRKNRAFFLGSVWSQLLSFFFFSFFPSLLAAVIRLSYRHEAMEWGRQSGNIQYHEERDAGPPWHGVHRAKTPPWPPQASAHKHTRTHAHTHTHSHTHKHT